ncbi:MAG: LysM peptidoglycan-binding domain-containing protein [Treponema sp.]|jgi:hypothetical protein|nr:LysM peptidoglycan-binding domain-containing protein [Treponema sp.]
MKKLFFSIPMVFVVFLVFSCASAPVAEPEPELRTEPEQQAPEEKKTEEQTSQDYFSSAFGKIYETYQSNIILKEARVYTVVRNDTASKIATKFYGRNNGYFFPLIAVASKDVIRDPDLIIPGMKLLIPDLQSNLADEEARKNIKALLRDMADVYAKKTSRWAPKTRRELITLTESI